MTRRKKMQTLWFILVGFMLTMYVVLDGFDLGAGAIHQLAAKNEHERRIILQAIGPVWDGNEVWRIAAGGTLFFTFPLLYASSFSGFYLPLFIVLWLLMVPRTISRDELVNLTFEHLQQREGRWVIVDIVGKGRRVRTVPVPGWAKSLLDHWAREADLRSGPVLRRFRKGGWLVYETSADGVTRARGMSADAIADVVSCY